MKYDYTVMPGEAWYGNDPGKYLEDNCTTYREAIRSALQMWNAGVRDIVINAYNLAAQELADFYYRVDDATGKIIKR